MFRDERSMAPNYTNAFLVSAAVLCMMILTTIWVVWGFLTALLISFATDRYLVFEGRRVRRND